MSRSFRWMMVVALFVAAFCALPATASPSTKSSTVNRTVEVLSLQGGGELRIPRGALFNDVGVKVSYSRPPGTGRSSIGSPVNFSLVGPRAHRRLLKPVTLILPAVGGRATVIRTYARGAWRIVPTTFYPGRGIVQARLHHFSWYGDFFSNLAEFTETVGNRFAQGFGEFQGTRAGQASCVPQGNRTATLPSWATYFAGANGANDVLRSCAQGEGDIVAVEIVNNRPYGIQIDFPVPVAWAWTEGGFSLREDGIKNTLLRSATDGMYVPPISRAAIGIPRGSWTSANFQSRVSRLSVFADMVDVALQEIGSANRRNNKSTIIHILNLLSADCSGLVLSLDATASAGDLVRFATDNTDCVRTVLAVAYAEGKIDPAKVSPKRFEKWLTAFNAWSKLRLADKFAQTFTDALFGINTGGFSVSASPPAVTSPTTQPGTVVVPPTQPGRASVARGPTAPAGYRYAITLSGFAPNAAVVVTCRDSVTPGGFFTFTLSVDLSGRAFVQNQCYSGDGPYHWVTANGVESNRVQWGAATTPVEPTPPPPTPPKPTASNLIVVVYGGGHVGVAFNVGWQAGRDPVTCHFFRDGVEVFTAQCGTSSSKQFYGVPPGTHSFYATVSDAFGVYSDPSNTVTRVTS